MKTIEAQFSCCRLLRPAASPGLEFGVAGGYAKRPATGDGDSAGGYGTAVRSGRRLSVYVGQNKAGLWAANCVQLHPGDARIESGGASTTFGAVTNEVHYDMMFHTSSKARVQVFLAVGGGVKIFQGTA